MLFSEPKIPQAPDAAAPRAAPQFQCSSASRKFLKRTRMGVLWIIYNFSALQRAENSSSTAGAGRDDGTDQISVLFSEPKIPQLFCCCTHRRRRRAISVLFSEPKIPQTSRRAPARMTESISVLFSEPKIPQCERSCVGHRRDAISVLFSEPKIPQCTIG